MKCEFQKHDGTICSANAQVGKDVCVFHDPAKTQDGQRARRAGGLARCKPGAILPPDAPNVQLGTYKDVANLLGESIIQVRRGELDPRVANAVGYLSGVLIRALEQGVVEERLAKIEAALGLDASSEKDMSKHDINREMRLVFVTRNAPACAQPVFATANRQFANGDLQWPNQG